MVRTHTALALAAALAAMPCAAHHGVAAHYDDTKVVSLDGTVSEFQFINPHSFVYLRVTTNGQDAVWHCEMASRSVLERNGLSAQMFAPGKHVRIEGSQARQNPTGCALREAHFDDGSALRSSTLFGATPAATAVPSAQSNAIDGVWAMKRFTVSRYIGELTDEGERRRAAFDPVKDDPAIYCDPTSPVRFWINVNEPFEIRREAARVVIDHQFMDSQRVVHLDITTPPAGVARSTMGYSTGHFDGAALVIETTNFKAGVLEPRYGVTHSENLKLTERLEVNPATHELEITWTIDDPLVFKQRLTQKEAYVRTERWHERYNCKPGYQQ
ncbi:MAG: DUF6152 family protein [Gammaproteobacteria bacterium]